jgi:hypothetical protein
MYYFKDTFGRNPPPPKKKMLLYIHFSVMYICTSCREGHTEADLSDDV